LEQCLKDFQQAQRSVELHLTELTNAKITKLAAYKNPPGAEHELMKAVYCLIDGEDYNKWSDAQASLKNAGKFKTQLKQVVTQ
jgi:hypothetical protein